MIQHLRNVFIALSGAKAVALMPGEEATLSQTFKWPSDCPSIAPRSLVTNTCES